MKYGYCLFLFPIWITLSFESIVSEYNKVFLFIIKVIVEMLLLFIFIVKLCGADDENMFDLFRVLQPKLNLDNNVFNTLENYHMKANVATETTYPWIAQLVHSRSQDLPYMCTAICVHEGVFMTASRCISSLKVQHTSILYKFNRLPVRAFVQPSKPTSQLFDDIGFVVIDTKTGVKYTPAALYPEKDLKRTDKAFEWFSKINFTDQFKVVGYATDKGIHKIKSPDREFNLKDLVIQVDMKLCTYILTNRNMVEGFNVPCYHSCSLAEFKERNAKCEKYLGVEGAAVFNMKTKKVLGVAIWGAYYPNYELPVGFSVVNSATFIEDFNCAKKIRNSTAKAPYQNLCK